MEQQVTQTERKKIWLMRIIAVFSALSFLLLLGMAAVLFRTAGELKGMAADFKTLSGELEEMSGKVQSAADSIIASTAGLADVDWAGLASSVQEAAASAEAGMQEASEALTTLDLESLNQAVADLGQVVAPLAQFVSRFG